MDKKLPDKEKSAFMMPSDDIITEASEESFPASDPLAWTLGSQTKMVFPEESVHKDLAHMLAFEHHIIKNVILSIQNYLKKNLEKVNLDENILEHMIEFFEFFVDDFHHSKEEMLFPFLSKGEGHLTDYLLHDLEHEHEYGKTLLADFKKDFTHHEEKSKLIHLIKSICDFYSNHLAKEEEYVLPAVNKLIDKQNQKTLITKFNEMEKKMGKSEYQRLVNLFKE